MTKTRELIESDQKYRQLKHLIFMIMNVEGETPWRYEGQWLDDLPGWSHNQYHRVVGDMLDDSEIEREYNREVIPNLTRWVMRNEKEE